jgi:hypothetical protein
MGAAPNLQRKLQQTLGAEAAGDLGAGMHSMDAHRTDMAALRREMQLGFAKIDERFAKMDERFAKMDERFTRIDERFARVDERFARMDGRMDVMTATFEGQLNAASERFERLLEKGLREQTRFFFLAWSVVLASIIGLYAR